MRLTLGEIALMTSGDCKGDPAVVLTGVSTDSRRVGRGDLFVALRGERFDGHDFVREAAEQASAVMIRESWAEAKRHPAPAVVVPDTLRGLGDLAAGWRSRFTVPVIGVTGSNGKTTVKEMIGSILGQGGKGCMTTGNLNNLIGLPLMLLSMTEEDQWGLFEMGMSEPGEIDRLAEIARPRIGVITNANPSHLESMGSVERVARAKGELFLRLPAGGCAVYCAEDERIARLPVPGEVRRVGYGITSGDVRAEGVEFLGDRGSRFRIVSARFMIPVTLPVPGRHNVLNALAASVAALEAGADPDWIVSGLERFSPFRQRFVLLRGEGVTIVDDTYNANPSSMRAAVETLAACAGRSYRSAILGEMRELGESSRELHRELGRMIAPLLDRLIVLGELGSEIAAGAREGGMAPGAVTSAGNADEAASVVIQSPHEGEWVLVKGSRGMRMERVVETLCRHFKAAADGGA